MADGRDKTAQQQPEELPEIILQEARAAAGSAQSDNSALNRPPATEHHHEHHHRGSGAGASLENVPPPAYNGADYGQLDISQNGLDTGARIGKDGRINIKINQRNRKLTNLLAPALRRQLDIQKGKDEALIPPGLGEEDGLPPPPMNIVIQIVGSRGDVQPFVALGQVLKKKYNHRVRIATHPTFRQFVTENGLEFFSIGGDPAELMAFMVKNPGLMPGMDSLKNGDVGKRRKGIYEIVTGCWRSCIEAGDGSSIAASDDLMDGRSIDSAVHLGDPTQKPFIADCIIANPPSFAHMHIAEKMGIPLHLMFTMPWSPTQSFPHPLANIVSSNTDANMANFMTYALVDMLTWQGLGDVINKFRERSLGLEPVSIMWAPGMSSRLRIPWTYCWSPALIPKPADWGNYIDISGFFFLNLATDYTPPQDLADFLAAGPPPVYIGFGSIVVDDPNAMTKMIFEAVKKTGQRALVSKGWGGLGADEMGIPEGVFMLGNCPHDWLFQHVSCVVHHGGAGTTAAGISAGKPTVVVPFFGDQPFWGAMCARAGAGPMPIPYKHLNADKLASQIMEALKPESLERAKELSAKIQQEKGTEAGAESFHKQLHLADLRCSLCPDRVAVWRIKRTEIRLSTLAATVLGNEGLLDFADLKLYRAREYETEDGPWDPISGGAAALIGTIGNLTMGVADFPVEVLKSLKLASNDLKEAHKERRRSGSVTPTPETSNDSKTDLTKSPTESTAVAQAMGPAEGATAPVDAKGEALTPSTSTTTLQDTELTEAGRRFTAMSSVMSPTGEPHSHHRRWSRSHSGSKPHSRSHSRSRSHHGHERPSSPAEHLSPMTIESTIDSARAMGKIVSAGVKSPMDFTLGLAKGFHNAPKLYGDDTVRKSEKITDLQSGLKAAGKEFGYGFYDGITGLVTQPLAGARKEGAAGFVKGAAKGIGGLILKPGAGIWGLPGYTAKGVYAELAKHFGSSVQNYIIAARTAQGYEEWKNSTPEQRSDIVDAWYSSKLENKKGGKKFGQEKIQEVESHIVTRTQSNNVQLVSGFKNTRHLSWDERKALAEKKEQLKREQKELKKRENEAKNAEQKGGKLRSQCKFCHLDHDSDHHLKHTTTWPNMAHPVDSEAQARTSSEMHDEFEEAIQKSVTATSRGNPEEDALIERALRASVLELHKIQSEKTEAQHPDKAYERAVQASILEVKRARAEKELGQPTEQVTGVVAKPHDDEDHDEELARALTQSLEEFKLSQNAGLQHTEHEHDPLAEDDSNDTEDDEDFQKTISESARIHKQNQEIRRRLADNDTIEIIDPTKEPVVITTEITEKTYGTHDVDDDDDEDLKRALTESEKESKDKEAEIQRQKTEEEVVLEYIKKQSLLEEEHRKKKEAAGAAT